MNRVSFFIAVVCAAIGFLPATAATVRIWEGIPYMSAQDSPFYAGIQAGTVHLEDFEDQQLNTPYVTSWDWPRVQGTQPNGWVVLSSQQGSSFRALGNTLNVFSVDADDGLKGDYLGLGGNTWACGFSIRRRRPTQ